MSTEISCEMSFNSWRSPSRYTFPPLSDLWVVYWPCSSWPDGHATSLLLKRVQQWVLEFFAWNVRNPDHPILIRFNLPGLWFCKDSYMTDATAATSLVSYSPRTRWVFQDNCLKMLMRYYTYSSTAAVSYSPPLLYSFIPALSSSVYSPPSTLTQTSSNSDESLYLTQLVVATTSVSVSNTVSLIFILLCMQLITRHLEPYLSIPASFPPSPPHRQIRSPLQNVPG